MGQLEKYGLYVLCLVIFLILGVAIFADGNGPAKAGAPAPTALNGGPLGAAPGGGDDRDRSNPPQRRASLLGDGNLANLALVRDPQGRSNQEPKPSPEQPAAGGNGAGVQGIPAGGGAQPAPAPAPLDSVRPTYKVKAGDSFEKIARTQLGNPALHTEIAKLNPKVEPTRIKPDQELVLPSKQDLAALQKAPPVPPTGPAKKVDAPKAAEKATEGAKADRPAPTAGARTHRIIKGDTFEGIAVRELGSRQRVGEIRQLNPDLDPTNLSVGTVIRLPAR